MSGSTKVAKIKRIQKNNGIFFNERSDKVERTAIYVEKNHHSANNIKTYNKYLPRPIDVVIASNTKISEEMLEKYHRKEEKAKVNIDHAEIKRMGVKLIEGDLIILDEDETLKHNSILLASLIFSYMMRNDYVVRY